MAVKVLINHKVMCISFWRCRPTFDNILHVSTGSLYRIIFIQKLMVARVWYFPFFVVHKVSVSWQSLDQTHPVCVLFPIYSRPVSYIILTSC